MLPTRNIRRLSNLPQAAVSINWVHPLEEEAGSGLGKPGPAVPRAGALLTTMTPTLVSQIDESLAENYSPSEGIFYIVPTPLKWQLTAWREDEYPGIEHGNAWDTEVTAYLAHVWSKVLNPNNSPRITAKLESSLSPYYSAFPRGRVSRGSKGLTVFWGENFPEAANHLKPAILRFFGLSQETPWEKDNHELCLPYDYQAVRKILPIKDTWPVAA